MNVTYLAASALLLIGVTLLVLVKLEFFRPKPPRSPEDLIARAEANEHKVEEERKYEKLLLQAETDACLSCAVCRADLGERQLTYHLHPRRGVERDALVQELRRRGYTAFAGRMSNTVDVLW